ncbi:hypothetical protein [Halohasta salina]|uniref:hypothetical protein n=1 Tax=Halohasta salina TaxID=2961621 RepID=UPI0020A4001A|nr:hypothetical protein [Halohasta salina]
MSPFEAPSEGFRSALWVVAVAFFGVGDLTTTAVGLQFPGVVEAGPVVGPVVDRYGIAGIGLVKCLVLAGSYGLWRAVPTPHRLGVPLGLAVVGVGVTGWNTVIVGMALAG